MREEFYAGLEDRKYLTLGDAQKKALKVWGCAGSADDGSVSEVHEQPRCTMRTRLIFKLRCMFVWLTGRLVSATECACQACDAGNQGVPGLPHRGAAAVH